MIKNTLSILIVFISMSAVSQQKNVNNYKYIIVSNKFDFLKSEDKYQTSSLTKFLLAKKGFTVFKSNENLPEDLNKDRCLALIANVVDLSGMFTTKSKIELRDCNNKLVYSSKEGKSKEKQYKKGYHEAIRKAYNSMTDISYSYQASKKNEGTKSASLEATLLKFKSHTPLKKDIQTSKTNKKSKAVILYAQAIKNGFQLVNTKPEVIFLVLKTSHQNLFIIRGKNGILYKKDNNWIAEFYEENKPIVKKYQVKF